VKYLNGQAAQLEDDASLADNAAVLHDLRRALFRLEKRAARRHNRELSSKVWMRADIENEPTCQTCGHIGCDGGRHRML
jgi:hypothetical protein